MEMASNETIKQAVIAGLGISFVSLHTVGLEIEHGQLVVLDTSAARLACGGHDPAAFIPRRRSFSLLYVGTWCRITG